jgi:two-component system, cell cycle response regulator DivK
MAKLLVVEDDPMIRDVLTRSLTLRGYEVCTAADGIAGVHRARVDRPDLIIMDMGLPGLNGWQASHRIRAMPLTRNIPIIALTAFVLKEDRERCLMSGCNDYEPKPIDFARLSEKIEALLVAHRVSSNP